MKVKVIGRSRKKYSDRAQLEHALYEVSIKIAMLNLSQYSTPLVFMNLDAMVKDVKQWLYLMSDRNANRYSVERPVGALNFYGYWIDSVNRKWTFTINMYGHCDIELKD